MVQSLFNPSVCSLSPHIIHVSNRIVYHLSLAKYMFSSWNHYEDLSNRKCLSVILKLTQDLYLILRFFFVLLVILRSIKSSLRSMKSSFRSIKLSWRSIKLLNLQDQIFTFCRWNIPMSKNHRIFRRSPGPQLDHVSARSWPDLEMERGAPEIGDIIRIVSWGYRWMVFGCMISS